MRARLVVVYSGFEVDTIDSISYIELDEHLGRLTARDLRQLETSVPLETLKTVIDLAVEYFSRKVIFEKDKTLAWSLPDAF